MIRGHAEKNIQKTKICSNRIHTCNKRNDWFDDKCRIAKTGIV